MLTTHSPQLHLVQPPDEPPHPRKPLPDFGSEAIEDAFWGAFEPIAQTSEPRPRALLTDVQARQWLYAPGKCSRGLWYTERLVNIDATEWTRRELRRSGVAVVASVKSSGVRIALCTLPSNKERSHEPAPPFGRRPVARVAN